MIQLAERVQRSFSRSFESYHAASGQQAHIADLLVQDLCQSGAPRYFASALELGCGTGHLTQRLCARFDFEALTLNDLSPEAQRTADAANAVFLGGDAANIDWPESLDLITSTSMIQWLYDPASFLRRSATALAPGGWLAVSGFGPQQYRELTQIGSTAKAPSLCNARELASFVEDDLEVVKTGNSIRQARFASARDVLDHLRKTGVNGRAQAPWTRSRLTQFIDDYTRLFESPLGLPLTYHAVWIIARKPG